MLTRYSFAQWFLLCIALFILQGCASPEIMAEIKSGQNPKTSAIWNNRADLAQGKAFYVAGNHERAHAVWTGLSDKVGDQEPPYFYPTADYLTEMEMKSNSAWAHLETGQLESGYEGYKGVFDYFRKATGEHQVYSDNRSAEVDKELKSSATKQFLFVAAVVGGGALANGDSLLDSDVLGALGQVSGKIEANKSVALTQLNYATELMETEQADEITEDNLRVVLMPSIGAATNIGKLLALDGTSQGACTASLVGKKLAVTAAHCVSNTNTGQFYRPDQLKFIFDDLYSQDRVSITKLHTAADRPFLHKRLNINLSQPDWALLELDRHPYGRGYFGVLDDADIPVGENLVAFGFSSDINTGKYLSSHWGCSTERTGQNYVDTNCRIFSGASGGPVVKRDNKRISHLYGVNSYAPDGKDSRGVATKTSSGFARSSGFIELLASLRNEKIEDGQLASLHEGLFDWNSQCRLSGTWLGRDHGMMVIQENHRGDIKGTSQHFDRNYKKLVTYQIKSGKRSGLEYVASASNNADSMLIGEKSRFEFIDQKIIVDKRRALGLSAGKVMFRKVASAECSA